MKSEKLLNPKELELIRQLSIQAKRKTAGLVTGEQRSPARGSGIEFADYREYQPGDDIRQIDWTVFLRMRKLLVKLCAEEKELTLMIIIDNSMSMCFGQPDKFIAAKKTAAILAGISLFQGNRAGILSMGTELIEVVRPERSRASFAKLVRDISKIIPVQKIRPVECIRQFSARFQGRCLVIFISDLLFPEWPQVISGLFASGCEAYVLHVLSQEELDPPYLGEITLVDAENLDEVPLLIQDEEYTQYRSEISGFLKEVQDACRRDRLGYSLLPTDKTSAEIFQYDLRKEGLLC